MMIPYGLKHVGILNVVIWYEHLMENIVHPVGWFLWIGCWQCTEIMTNFSQIWVFSTKCDCRTVRSGMDKMHRSLLVRVLYGCESELFRFVTNNYIPSTFNVSLFHCPLPGLRLFWVHITTGRNKFEYRVELRDTARRYVMLIHLF